MPNSHLAVLLEPAVFERGGAFWTNSRTVADMFGRLHKNVLQAIDNVDCSAEFRRLNFQPIDYIDRNGDRRRSIDMTRDGFTFAVMGFTGKEAALFKEEYIGRFNDLEAIAAAARSKAILGAIRRKGWFLSRTGFKDIPRQWTLAKGYLELKPVKVGSRFGRHVQPVLTQRGMDALKTRKSR